MHEVIKISTLSEGDIGKHIGVSRQYVHQWSSGKRPIPDKYKYKLYKMMLKTFLTTIEEQRKGLKMLEKNVVNQEGSPQSENK